MRCASVFALALMPQTPDCFAVASAARPNFLSLSRGRCTSFEGVRALWPLALSVAFIGCAADSPSAHAPTRDGELAPARDAYAAFCGMCPTTETCCLGARDFTPAHYSANAGRYLRALREHYECRRGDTLIDVALSEQPQLGDPRVRAYDEPAYPVRSRTRWSCEQSACAATAEIMAAELDRALATPVPHPAGALVACGTSQ